MILRKKLCFTWLLAVCSSSLSGLSSAVLAATPAALMPAPAQAPVAVGEVSFVIGAARIATATAAAVPVTRGQPVYAGSAIETEGGGHVHVRFVDGAFISVRPGSRLVVETYRYDAAHPQDSAIRFQLERGVARSITGRGGEAARERFRLNTPIAAIGVKGTDFVVQATRDQVHLAVNTGAVVLAPIGEGCSAETFGPCQTTAARTLAADMGRVMLEFKRNQGVPNIVPLNGQTQDKVIPPAPEEPRTLAQRHGDANVETLAAQTVGTGLETVAPPPALPPATLVWGRWSWVPPLATDTNTQSYLDARQEGAREAVSGNIQLATLFRPVIASDATLPTNLGQANFALRDAEVYLQRSGSYTAGRVTNAWLQVDFGARAFATELTAQHAETGAVTVAASGKIDKQGVFLTRTPDTYLGGAVTLDGQEAAYHFERKLPVGSLLGLTRWAR